VWRARHASTAVTQNTSVRRRHNTRRANPLRAFFVRGGSTDHRLRKGAANAALTHIALSWICS
jgi:hypothetical protein